MKPEDKITIGLIASFTTYVALRLLRDRAYLKTVKGVGRLKRRIYKEVAIAQDYGIDFTKSYLELEDIDKKNLSNLGRGMMWKQSKRSIESGKSYEESYYNSLKRAWNAISGLDGVGTIKGDKFPVKNADGETALIWYNHDGYIFPEDLKIQPAVEHVQSESKQSLDELEEDLKKARKRIARRGGTQHLKDLITPNLQNDEPANEQHIEVPEHSLTIQQKILKKLPYLKTYDHPDGVVVSDKFNYVVWVKQYNQNGELLYEAPQMAFIGLEKANEYKEKAAKAFKDSKTDLQYKYKSLMEVRKYSVIPVRKVKIESISGIGLLIDLPEQDNRWIDDRDILNPTSLKDDSYNIDLAVNDSDFIQVIDPIIPGGGGGNVIIPEEPGGGSAEHDGGEYIEPVVTPVEKPTNNNSKLPLILAATSLLLTKI